MAGKKKIKPETKKKKNPGGRPTDYNEKIAKEICRVVATTGKGLVHLCAANEHWPEPSTIYLWRIMHREFSDMYTDAKISQVEVLVDQTLDIADDMSRDTLIKQNKNDEDYEVQNSEWMNRSRLRVDTRKWLAAKLAPRIYGDRMQHEVGGKDGEAIQIETKVKLAKRELDARYANMALNKITEDSEDGN